MCYWPFKLLDTACMYRTLLFESMPSHKVSTYFLMRGAEGPNYSEETVSFQLKSLYCFTDLILKQDMNHLNQFPMMLFRASTDKFSLKVLFIQGLISRCLSATWHYLNGCLYSEILTLSNNHSLLNQTSAIPGKKLT